MASELLAGTTGQFELTGVRGRQRAGFRVVVDRPLVFPDQQRGSRCLRCGQKARMLLVFCFP